MITSNRLVGLTAALLLALPGFPTRAEVGDPTIRTDHPDYPGEGAFQTIEDCVRFAAEAKESQQDKAIALYLWMLKHQYHLMSPQEPCVPGRTPDTAKPGDYEMVPFDANRARFSYGYGLCGTVHAWNEPYWQALGMPARRRAFPGHVNSEVFYGGSWHAFDTDMAGLLFRKDGKVAGYDDIIRDPALVDSTRPPLPHYPFAWPSDFETMKRGWLEVAKSGKPWYRLYNSGYAAHPGVVQLRAGESFTRWFDRDHYGGPTKRRFWHHLDGGPQRHWTFLNADKVFHDGKESTSRNRASYCNGEFVYRPPLDRRSSREGMCLAADNLGHQAASPRLHTTDDKTTHCKFRHFSPYVICGDPEDDANAMSGPASGGLIVEGKMVGNVPFSISTDEGLSWTDVEYATDAEGRFRVDLTDRAKGSYGWQLHFVWGPDAGIDQLRFTTVTQVAQGIYPRLKSAGSRVTYRSGSRGVVAALPDFGLPDRFLEKLEVLERRTENVERLIRGPDSRVGYSVRGSRPGQVVYKLVSPQPLLEVRAAIRYQLRVPPPEKTDYRLEISTDEGESWRTFARAEIPPDNEFSSGWLAGRAKLEADAVRQALVRVTLFADGHRTGLIQAQLYGIHRTGPPQPLQITHGWKDAQGALRTHTEDIPADALEKAYVVPTGAVITDDFVRLAVP